MMAIFRCSFRSKVQSSTVCFNVVIPEGLTQDIPVVLLLHGLSGNQDSWLEGTPLEKIAAEKGFAMVLPDGRKSWYCDMKYGDQFFTYMVDELMDYVRAIFPVSKRREKTFVAGLSMGGYGALKMALARSEQFAACGALSGAVDILSRMQKGDKHDQCVAIWGEDYLNVIPGSPDDTFHLARQLEAAGKPKPWIYQACGTEDKRLGENHSFRDFIRDRGYVYEYYEGPGRHNWDFWNPEIRKTLDFFNRCMESHGAK